MKVLTFSRRFPKKHPKAGEPTMFVEKIWRGLRISAEYSIYISVPKQLKNGKWQVPVTWRGELDKLKAKLHTIRAGKRWRVGDMASLRVWSGKPYHSKQKEFAQVQIKKIFDFTFHGGCFSVNGEKYFGETESDFELLEKIAGNDGLTRHELVDWFKQPKNKTFEGQILCWSDKINY